MKGVAEVPRSIFKQICEMLEGVMTVEPEPQRRMIAMYFASPQLIILGLVSDCHSLPLAGTPIAFLFTSNST